MFPHRVPDCSSKKYILLEDMCLIPISLIVGGKNYGKKVPPVDCDWCGAHIRQGPIKVLVDLETRENGIPVDSDDSDSIDTKTVYKPVDEFLPFPPDEAEWAFIATRMHPECLDFVLRKMDSESPEDFPGWHIGRMPYPEVAPRHRTWAERKWLEGGAGQIPLPFRVAVGMAR